LPNPKVNGSLAAIRQPTEVSYDPARGLQITQRWESAGDNLSAIATSYQAARISYNLTRSTHKSVLVATAGGGQVGYGEIATDTWQILANEIQKDLLQHNRSLAIDAAQIREIDRGIRGDSNGKLLSSQLTISGDAVSLYDLLFHDQTHFALGQYVLKHTTNVSNSYGINIADLNVEKIYTTAQLLAEVTNSALWTFPMPGRLQYKISNLPAPIARSGYLWGWRKLPSTETTAAGNRIDITTEYWLEQWSTYSYGTV
jgi:hypothetical protein